ncbi:hypothetical protein [Paracidobacterium acidisoli]|uniref:Tetratricopeptide repeat protein n=1 Tax=Paracidobacterium acidisoli TaxID=2303751 RepID=A0A372ITZ3_9BACT|nr:hypothetical protein [Paracidobacterium acidisoli]MBT9329832.1 hypothetical protein [Paracidobacterium acidisoli]
MNEYSEVPGEPNPDDVSGRDDLNATIRSMKQEIDALQITVMTQKKVWYRDASTIISFLALAFSFGSTFVSYHRANLQDIQSERQELRGLLQRLAALPKENLEAAKRFAPDQTAINIAGSLINEENALLSRQAAELEEHLPKGTVSATEYYAVAIALQNSYNLEGARKFLKLAADNATDFNDEIGAIRSTANLEFLTGHPEAGRVKYQEALDIFAKYPGYDQYTQTSTNVYTESQWATSEASLHNLPLASQHIESAERLMANLPVTPGSQTLKQQVAQLKQTIMLGTSAIGQPQSGLALPVDKP